MTEEDPGSRNVWEVTSTGLGVRIWEKEGGL